MINIGKDNRQKAKSLLRLLRIVFAKDMTPQEKKNSLAGDYDIAMTEDLKEGMSEMCNLSEALIEEAMEEATAKTKATVTADIIAKLLLSHTPLSVIMNACDATMETIRKVAGERGLAIDY